MQALVWEAPSSMAVQETETPAPAAGEVLIKVAYAGICGSELSGYLGHNALRVPPLIMGHEFSGEIVAFGAGVEDAFPALAVGQAVTVNPLAYCGECDQCRAGLNQLCPQRNLLGAHRPGAYAAYVTAPAFTVTTLPSGVSLRTGALTEPVACAVRIGELAGDVDGRAALIIGAGPIGLLALQILRQRGAGPVWVADLDRARLGMAADLGGLPLDPRAEDVVDTVRAGSGGDGVAVAVDAVGSALTRRQCVSALAAAGTLILTGLHEEVSEMPVADMIRREIRALGSFAYTPANFAEAVTLLADDRIRLDPWVVEAPLADGGEWFDRLIEAPGDVSKVLLVPAG